MSRSANQFVLSWSQCNLSRGCGRSALGDPRPHRISKPYAAWPDSCVENFHLQVPAPCRVQKKSRAGRGPTCRRQVLLFPILHEKRGVREGRTPRWQPLVVAGADRQHVVDRVLPDRTSWRKMHQIKPPSNQVFSQAPETLQPIHQFWWGVAGWSAGSRLVVSFPAAAPARPASRFVSAFR